MFINKCKNNKKIKGIITRRQKLDVDKNMKPVKKDQFQPRNI